MTLVPLQNHLLHGNATQQRRALAKAITLMESTRPDHREQADALLTALLPHTGRAFRLGLSGVPGVGKSTFIEALGLHLVGQGLRVAVLAVDPSSSVSGGSILGDKTRMEQLSVHPMAFIRPSPSSGTLGGVAEKTREALLVCEAAGYDVVVVETVGVGQSETAVHGMTDCFALLQLPNAGDDLQALKKGVMELADLVVINKVDLDPAAATRAQAHIVSSLRLVAPPRATPAAPAGPAAGHAADLVFPQVLPLSALSGQGVADFWALALRFKHQQQAAGAWDQRRQSQALTWMWQRIEAGLKAAFQQQPQVAAQLPTLTEQVQAGQLAPSVAARRLLQAAQQGVA